MPSPSARHGGRRALFAVATLVAVLLGTEAALRLAGWPSSRVSQGPEGFTHAQVYWVEPANQALVPHPHKETGGSFRVSTDANGLRAPVHAEQKPDGVYRILALGCSTTFGWGVEDAETYPARLEAHLREAGHAKVEVVNGGQPGYTSFQGLWLWDKVLARYQPDLVLFGYVVQDSRQVAYTDRSQAILQKNGDFLKQNLLYRLHLYTGLKGLIDARRIETKEQGGQNAVYRVPPDEYVENLRAFKARTDAVGADLALFGFPLEREGYTGEHRRILHAAAEVLEVPVYDPQPDMERATMTQTLYFPQDRGHANAAGLDWIAKDLAQRLVADRRVP